MFRSLHPLPMFCNHRYKAKGTRAQVEAGYEKNSTISCKATMPQPSKSLDFDESQHLMDPDHFVRDGEDLFDISGEKLLPTTWSHINSIRRHLPLNNVLRDPKSCLVSTILFLLPSFVVEPLRNHSHSTQYAAARPQLSPTAWLDGLRGIAALTVYIFHWSMLWFSFLMDPYGAPGSANTIFQLPIIRTLNSGQASVATFFMISGYVITIKTLSTIYKGGLQNNERVLTTLCGALFRRPFRLFVPAIISTFIIAVINQQTGIMIHSVRRLPDMRSQLVDWFHETLHMMNTFNLHKTRYNFFLPHYNTHLWTIPIEFKNSILVFVLILAFSKVKRWIHLMGVVGVMWCLLDSQGDTDAALFCAGLILAEITLIFPPISHRARARPTSTSRADTVFKGQHENAYQSHGIMHWTGHFITIGFAMTGLHLMGYPLQVDVHSGGFHTISEMAPRPFYPEEGSVPFGQQMWSIAIGAIMYITACTYSAPLHLPPHISRWIPTTMPWPQSQRETSDATTILSAEEPTSHTPFLQIPHTTRFAQYLGWLSYSLYLTHGAGIISVGMRYYNQAQPAWTAAEEAAKQLQASGHEVAAAEVIRTAWNAYVAAFLWSTVLQTIVIFWISDLFARAIDANMVKLTRWLWNAAKTK